MIREMNPVHALQPYFLEISLNIILRSAPWSSKWNHTEGLYEFYTICDTRPVHFNLLISSPQ